MQVEGNKIALSSKSKAVIGKYIMAEKWPFNIGSGISNTALRKQSQVDWYIQGKAAS